MKDLINRFPFHLTKGLEIGLNFRISDKPIIKDVLISGLGGSGIGGSIVSELVAQKAKIPVNTNKDYSIPAFVGECTLVIISSYSGNTEETLAVLQKALEKKAQIACITSGGKVGEIAKEKNLPHIIIPGGLPPRAAFGLSFPQLLFVLNQYGVIGNDFADQIKDTISLLESEKTAILSEAKKVAKKIKGKTLAIYSSSLFEGVATRFQQQLHENSKQLAWHNVFPELNHNELVGWDSGDDSVAVILLNYADDFYRVKERMRISKDIMAEKTNCVIELQGKGENQLIASLYYIHLCDWISYFLAIEKNKDPMEIKAIDFLKSELAKL